MSLTQKIAHNTSAQIIGKTISTFLGLVAIAMMTRYLGKEQFGWYVTTISFLQFIGILTDFGMTPVTAQMLGEAKHDKKELLKNSLTFRLVTSIFFLGIAPLIALLFPYPTEVKIAISFTTISFLAIAINQVFTALFQERLKMHLQATSEVIGRIALVVGLFLVMQYGHGFLWVMGIVTLASVVFTIAMYLFARRETPVSLAFDKTIWKEIMIKMWPIAIAIIFNVVYLKGDILILSVIKTQGEVSIYGAAYRVIDILTQVAMMIMGVMLPLLAASWTQKKTEEFRLRYQMSFDSMMLIALPMVTGVIILSHKIMVMIGGPEFYDSGYPLQILSFAVLAVFVGGVYGHLAVAVDKQKQVMWIYIATAILTLIGYLIFIPQYGMYGAAWMTVFSEVFTGFSLALYLRKHITSRLHLKTFAKMVIATIIMGDVVYLLIDLHIVLLILVAMVVYGLALLGLEVVSKGTLKEIMTLK